MATALLGHLAGIPGKLLAMIGSLSGKAAGGEKQEPAATPPPEETYLTQTAAAIDRMKETAKWTVNIFAALAAILIAGTQLSSLGQLPGNQWLEDHRLLVAFVAGIVALLAIGAVINSALSVLSATPKSLDALATEERETKGKRTRDVQFVYASNLLESEETIQAFQGKMGHLVTLRNVAEQTGNPDAIKRAYAAVAYQNDRIETFQTAVRYETVRLALAMAQDRMLVAGLIGAVAIGAFTWAANPPTSGESAAPFLNPASAYAVLSTDSQDKWEDVLGADCVANPIYVMVLSSDDDGAEVVTVTGTHCAVARFTISLDELYPVRAVPVPTREDAVN